MPKAATTELQFDWGGADTDTVAGGANEVSDTRTVDASTDHLSIHAKITRTTTDEDSNDECELYLEWTGGDREGSGGGDEYDTEGQGERIGSIDLSKTKNTYLQTFPNIRPGGTSCRLRAYNRGSNTFTISANMTEWRVS